MRQLFVFLLALTISVPLAAQRGGGSRGGGGGGGRGFSSGGGRSFSSGASRGGSFSGVSSFRGGGSRVIGSVGGFRGGYGGYRGGYGFRGGYGYRGYYSRGFYGFGLYGYGWPYYGYGYGYGYGYPYSYGGYDYGYDPYYSTGYNYAPAYNYAPQQSPVVIVNRTDPGPGYYDDGRQMAQRRPAMDYEQDAENQGQAQQAPAYRPPIYKIAFTDHKIASALAYWVKDGRLHYVSMDHGLHDVPLSEVDRRYSEQINRDAGLEFRLPAAVQ